MVRLICPMHFPAALALMAKLAAVSRKRWPTSELTGGAAVPGVLPGSNGDGQGRAAAVTAPATEP